MEIEELQTFVAVADAGGISPAARRLGLASSTISRRLARLEAQLGVQLLSRTSGGAALTQAGIVFRDHAARACAAIGLARGGIAQTGELRDRLRIAAAPAFAPTHFAPVVAEMARRHPLLHIHICHTDRAVNLIAEGYDCALRVGHLEDANPFTIRIGPVPAAAVASPDYIRVHGAPATPDALLVHQAVMKGAEPWYFMDGATKVAVRPRGRYQADSDLALAAAALAGIGIAYLPIFLIREHLDCGALVPLLPHYPAPSADAYLVHRPGRHPSRKVRVLAQLLIDQVDAILRTAGAPSGSPWRDAIHPESALPPAR